MVYFHTGKMEVTQEEQQFNLTMIAKSIGSTIVTGGDVWVEETVALTANAGVVVGTPIATSSGNIYGWAELSDGSSERFTFSGKNLTLVGQATGNVCVRYYKVNSAARVISVNANIIPDVVRTVIDAQMFSGDPSSVSTSTLVGKVLVEIPRLQLDGSAKLNLTSTGVSSTPIKGQALASVVSGCSGSGIYATIKEVLDSANWYDNVNILAVADDTITLTHPTTSALEVWAIPSDGSAAFKPPVADLTFTSGTAGTATIGIHTGLITTVATGTSILSVAITARNTITTTATLTVN